MNVRDSALIQRIGELLMPELRIPSRLRDLSYVNQSLDAMHIQHFEKLLDGVRRMADGEYGQG